MSGAAMLVGACLVGPTAVTEFEAVAAAALSAEHAGFDVLCLPDRPGLDPIALAAGLAAVTERIGLIPACTAPYHQPYNLARRLGSIDHISRGRLGWALKPMPDAQEAARFGNITLPDPITAHAHAGELVAVVEGLWDSWDDDAFIRDKARGLYFDRAKFHWLSHQGARFKVRGPLDTARPPQGRPPLMVSGGTPLAEDLAIGSAEIFLSFPQDLAAAQAGRARVAQRLAQAGRAPGALKMLCGVTPGLGPMTRPTAMAETMAAWFTGGVVDGFILHLPDAPEAIAEVAAQVLPALERLGLRRAGQHNDTLREALGLGAAPSRYAAQVA